jgi:voltage-gated potassium channel
MAKLDTKTVLNKIKNGTDSFGELIAIYLISALVVGALFALFEGRNLLDAYWWTFITGLTIGYGDIYPVTAAGQILTVVWAHFAVLVLIPLFIGRLIVTMIEDKNKFTHEEQIELFDTVKRIEKKLK